MATKHLKTCSINMRGSLGKRQMKTTIRCHCTSIRVVKISSDNTKCWRVCKGPAWLLCSGVYYMQCKKRNIIKWHSHSGKQLGSFFKMPTFRDFLGGSVAKIPNSQCRGPVSFLVRELDPTYGNIWHRQRNIKNKKANIQLQSSVIQQLHSSALIPGKSL